jgi:hypothetical protein
MDVDRQQRLAEPRHGHVGRDAEVAVRGVVDAGERVIGEEVQPLDVRRRLVRM